MKKLLFAIAGAASFAALAADPAARTGDISLVGFENYTADQTVIGYGDDGNSGGSLWTASGDDASLVKTYGGDNATAPSITEPAPFAGETNTKYLALDTNGSELQRAVPAVGQTIAADGTYVDTLVQFTPSESAPTSADLTDAKLAIWLGVENNVTNLMVQAGAYDGELSLVPTGAVFALTKATGASLTVEPGSWYRLTVKALPNQSESEEFFVPAFEIRLDGDLLAAVNGNSLSSDALESFGETFSSEVKDQFEAGTLFIPVCSVDVATLTSVGFKGTGALDDFVVTTVAPDFTPAAISLTLTWTAAEVTGVSYVLESDPATTNVVTSGTAVSIPAAAIGTNVTLIATFESGYEFDYLDIGGYQLQSLTFPVPPVSTNATLVAKAAAAYPTYIDTSDGTIKGKYDAWKTAYQADTASQWESAFLLNMDPTAQVAAGTALLKIASITEVSGGWELEIASEATTLTATDGTVLVGNGYLRIIAADTIAGLANATPTYINVAVTNGKITVTVPAANGKFMKAELTTEAPSNN